VNRSPRTTLLAAVAVAALAACSKEPAPAPAQPPQASPAQPAALKLAKEQQPGAAADGTPAAATSARTPWVRARAAEGVSLLEAPATVLPAPEGVAAVTPPFRARITRIAVRAGEKVARGQVIAEVVMPEVVQAAGAYAAATTRLEAYQRRKDQLDGLKKEGLVKLSDLLESETKLAEARADQQSALATLRAADLAAADARRILDGSGQVGLRSPISGMVHEVKASIGETREAAGEPIARVAADGETRVEARLAYAPPPNAKFELILPDGTRHPVDLLGRAPVVDPRDGTTAAWFAGRNGGARLPAGLSARLAVKMGEAAAAVPARAVALDGKQAYVVRNVSGKPQRLPVQVLATSGADALVKGIEPGAEVAADAALAASEEQP
jgi:biotin carboxyl carrier protein